MIKSDFGEVEIRGSKIVVMGELDHLITCLLREKALNENDIDEVVKQAKKHSEKSIEDEPVDFPKLKEALKRMVDEIFSEDEEED